MKFQIISSLTALSAISSTASALLKGQDVSSYQGTVNWNTQKSKGTNFAYIKATEGTTYFDSKFNTNYEGATKAGLIRGAYHFARPGSSSGAAQAEYFLGHGGGWSSDGRTLPGAVDLEYNPSGATCYGLSHASMVSWIKDFGSTYEKKTGRYPVIYTTTNWWEQCTGNSKDFSNYPLWLASYASKPGALPASWTYYSFWQNADSGALSGDQDYWNGSLDNLKKFVKG